MPTVLVIAGPNGAGRTTFANEILRRRVAMGGHDIREADIRRRFRRSLDYLDAVYQPIVDRWQVWSNGDDGLKLLDWFPR